MFLTATISIDPSDPTEYVASETESSESELVEHETFSTSQILQQLVVTMRDVGVTNAQLLSHDGDVLFHDRVGESDDLTNAIRQFAATASAEARQQFDNLRLVLEHEGPLLSVVIDISVDRVHSVNVHPVEIGLVAFLTEFRADGEFSSELHARFDPVFEDQAGYDAVTAAMWGEFEELLKGLQAAIHLQMNPEQVETDWSIDVVDCESQEEDATSNWRQLFDHSCISQDDVLYCYHWHRKCQEQGIRLSECDVVSQRGAVLRRYGKLRPVEEDLIVDAADEELDSPNPLHGLRIPREKWPEGPIPFFGPFKRDVWTLVADELGAEFTRGGFFRADKVIYWWGNFPITLDTYTTGGEDSQTYTRMRVVCSVPASFKCKVYREGIFSLFGKMLGMQDIEIGDRWFDEVFVVKGNDPESVKILLSDAQLRSLISIQPRIELSISSGIEFESHGVIKDPDLLVRLFELFIHLLMRFEAEP